MKGQLSADKVRAAIRAAVARARTHARKGTSRPRRGFVEYSKSLYIIPAYATCGDFRAGSETTTC